MLAPWMQADLTHFGNREVRTTSGSHPQHFHVSCLTCAVCELHRLVLLCGSVSSIPMSTNTTLCRFMPSASHKVPPGYDKNCAKHQFGRSPDTAEVFVRDDGVLHVEESHVIPLRCLKRLLTDRSAFAVQPPVCVQIGVTTSGRRIKTCQKTCAPLLDD